MFGTTGAAAIECAARAAELGIGPDTSMLPTKHIRTAVTRDGQRLFTVLGVGALLVVCARRAEIGPVGWAGVFFTQICAKFSTGGASIVKSTLRLGTEATLL